MQVDNRQPAMVRNVTDEDLIKADVRTLTKEQMIRRHRIMVERYPLLGALKQFTAEQLEQITQRIRAERSDLVIAIEAAEEKWIKDRDTQARENTLFDLARSTEDFVASIGFPRTEYSVGHVYWKLRLDICEELKARGLDPFEKFRDQ